VDVNETDRDGCTPLHVALFNSATECVKLLLENGAESWITVEGSPALHVAVTTGSLPHFTDAATACVEALIASEADVFATDDYGRSPLHLAATHGLSAIADALLEQYPTTEQLNTGDEDQPDPINARDKLGWTPLHHACYGGHADIVNKLLARGSKPGKVTKAGLTSLHAAVVGRNVAAVTAVMNAEPSILNNACNDEKTAVEMADARGYPLIAAVLRGEDTSAVETPPPPPPPVIIAPDECFMHHSCPPITRDGRDPPPENVNRLQVLLNKKTGILRAAEFSNVDIVSEVRPATMADVLRVHEYPYVRKIQKICERIPDWNSNPNGALGTIDGDTEVCHSSFSAALCAAGAVVEAVDRVVAGSAEKVFCAVRPPGHHAGPNGPVPAPGDPIGSGSHGFCLLNNVALGAAYARCVHRHSLRRVAIIDFDVHHGNGTEAVVQNTTPAAPKFNFSTPYCEGAITVPTYRPWLDETDHEEVFFASVHGYGRARGFNFYPGSGPTDDTRHVGDYLTTEEAAQWNEEGVVDDPYHVATAKSDSTAQGPTPWVVDVGMEGTGKKAERGAAWRRVWRGKTLPAIAAFKPDLVLISAGFDAHAKDDIQGPVNLGVKEADYEWLTEELCKIANTCCQGRVISVLEGGYRIQGGVVSAFGRSVASHLRAMFRENREGWSAEQCQKELDIELKQRRLAKEADEAKRAAAMEAARQREEAAIAAAQAAMEAAGGDGDEAEAAAAAAAAAVLGDEAPTKRRRKAVDYTQLNAELEKESNPAAAEAEEPAAEAEEPAAEAVEEEGEEDVEENGEELEMEDEDGGEELEEDLEMEE